MNAFHCLLGIALWCGLHSAQAKSSLIELTPTQLKVAGFEFTFTPKRLPGGEVELRVVITAKRARICSTPKTTLGTVTIRQTPTSRSESVGTNREIPHERRDDSLVCVFTLTPDEIKNPKLCFIFANQAESIVDGKIRAHPSMSFFYAKLEDFTADVVAVSKKKE